MDRTLPHYDLVVIGSGSGNSLLDERFNDLKVALVDRGGIDNGTRDLGPTEPGVFGGTCLNVGCIPTKMLVYPADLAISGQESGRLGGVGLPPGTVDWPAIRDRIFTRIDGGVAEGGLDWREQNPNITVYRGGEARFTGPKTLGVAGGKITADRFVIAAGSRPHALSVRGGRRPPGAHLGHDPAAGQAAGNPGDHRRWLHLRGVGACVLRLRRTRGDHQPLRGPCCAARMRRVPAVHPGDVAAGHRPAEPDPDAIREPRGPDRHRDHRLRRGSSTSTSPTWC